MAVVWIRPKDSLVAPVGAQITLGMLAEFAADDAALERTLRGTVMLGPVQEGQGAVAVSSLDIIRAVRTCSPNADISVIGADVTVVRPHIRQSPMWSSLLVVAVSVLLFFGAMLAIMFFHADVEMEVVHRAIYHMVTGRELERPLVLQIPYSIGVGLGVLLFFNSLSRRRPSSDPSPLDMQMYLYDKDSADYLASEDTPRPGPLRKERAGS